MKALENLETSRNIHHVLYVCMFDMTKIIKSIKITYYLMSQYFFLFNKKECNLEAFAHKNMPTFSLVEKRLVLKESNKSFKVKLIN